ncbi:hypothetical protein MIDIC_60015 [Alphaproteobacteria bacterium]
MEYRNIFIKSVDMRKKGKICDSISGRRYSKENFVARFSGNVLLRTLAIQSYSSDICVKAWSDSHHG